MKAVQVVIVTMLMSMSGSVMGMPEVDPKCDKAHLKAARKHATCVMKELAKSFHVPKGDFVADFEQCDAKFDQKFSKALNKATAAGQTCTVTDGEPVKTDIKSMQTDIHNNLLNGTSLPPL